MEIRTCSEEVEERKDSTSSLQRGVLTQSVKEKAGERLGIRCNFGVFTYNEDSNRRNREKRRNTRLAVP